MIIRTANFKKRLAAAILVCILTLAAPLFACANNERKAKTAEQLFAEIAPSVCTVRSAYSEGTGFVIKTQNQAFYVLTNKHVFESGTFTAQAAQVKFINNKSYDAELIGFGTYHDIAVLKISAAPHEGINPLEFNIQTAANGQRLYSIGNALELGLAMFDGIVSFNDRALDIDSASKRVPVMQITVPVNAGSSGAPVFDEYGFVAGVATYQIPMYNGRPVDGVSFCVDAAIAKAVADEILRGYNKSGEPVGECNLMDIKLASGSDKRGIDVAALNFKGSLSGGAINVESCSSIESDAGVQLEPGDKITKIGALPLEGANFSGIFCELYKFADTRLDDNVNVNVPLKIYFTRNSENMELTVRRKYEKNS